MAYVGNLLSAISQTVEGNFTTYGYFGTDALATVLTANYISDGQKRGMEVGNIVFYLYNTVVYVLTVSALQSNGYGVTLSNIAISSYVASANITTKQIPNNYITSTSFTTDGFATAGDGNYWLYVPGTSSGLGAVQDASGKYWQIADRRTSAMVGSTGSGTTARLTCDGLAAGASNILNLPASYLLSMSGSVTISDSLGNVARFKFDASLTNLAGTCALVSAATISPVVYNATSAGWSIQITADATNLGINITITAASFSTVYATLTTEGGPI